MELLNCTMTKGWNMTISAYKWLESYCQFKAWMPSKPVTYNTCMRWVKIAFQTLSLNSWRKSGITIEKKMNLNWNNLDEKAFYQKSISKKKLTYECTYMTRNLWISLKGILHPLTINTSPIVEYPGSCFVDFILSVFSICMEVTALLIISFCAQSTNLIFPD